MYYYNKNEIIIITMGSWMLLVLDKMGVRQADSGLTTIPGGMVVVGGAAVEQ